MRCFTTRQRWYWKVDLTINHCRFEYMNGCPNGNFISLSDCIDQLVVKDDSCTRHGNGVPGPCSRWLSLLNVIWDMKTGEVRTATDTREFQNSVEEISSLCNVLEHLGHPAEGMKKWSSWNLVDSMVFCSMEVDFVGGKFNRKKQSQVYI